MVKLFDAEVRGRKLKWIGAFLKSGVRRGVIGRS